MRQSQSKNSSISSFLSKSHFLHKYSIDMDSEQNPLSLNDGFTFTEASSSKDYTNSASVAASHQEEEDSTIYNGDLLNNNQPARYSASPFQDVNILATNHQAATHTNNGFSDGLNDNSSWWLQSFLQTQQGEGNELQDQNEADVDKKVDVSDILLEEKIKKVLTENKLRSPFISAADLADLNACMFITNSDYCISLL